MRFITVTLNPCIDKTYRFDRPIVTGEVNRPVSVTVTPGGKGINVAEALFELIRDDVEKGGKIGFDRVFPIFFAGGDSGRALSSMIESTDLLRIAEFGCSNVVLPLPDGEQTRTCIKLMGSDGSVTEINELGARLDDGSLELLIGTLTDMIQDGEKPVVLLCGSIPQGVETGVYNLLITLLKGCGITVVLDCSGEPLKEGIKASPDLIKPNLEELSYLAGRSLDYETEAVEFSKELFNSYGCEVLCTNGGKGAFFVGESGVTFARINTVSTGEADTGENAGGAVGCGDTFLAAFVSVYYKGSTKTVEDSMRLAVSAGKAAADEFNRWGGVSIPSGEKMRAFTDQVEIRKI